MVVDTNDRRTPLWFFDQCKARFGGFELDLAANAENHLCPSWLGPGSSIAEDALSDKATWGHYTGLLNWCNPPYGPAGVIPKWIAKARHERDVRDCRTLMLLPADTSTDWFYDVWRTELCELVPFRLSFATALEEKPDSAKFGSLLVYMAPRLVSNGRRKGRSGSCERAQKRRGTLGAL